MVLACIIRLHECLTDCVIGGFLMLSLYVAL